MLIDSHIEITNKFLNFKKHWIIDQIVAILPIINIKQ